jgi:uncharacterized membrane protein
MAEIAKQARRRGKSATEDATSTVGEQAGDVTDQARDAGDDQSDANGSRPSGERTITSELKDTFREAAIEVLRPVMRQATTEAAKFAVKRGPGLVKDRVAPKIQDAGGAGALAKGVASKGGGVAGAVGGIASSIGEKLPGGGGKKGESPSGTGRGRRLPVQEYVDVGVDLQTAYDQFTQFEDWPQFMHRVERIEQRDDATLMWHENIWGVRRSWEAEITDQIPCERIVWRSTSGPQSIGVVTFHSLSDNLTRIAITMDFQPKGLFEKTSSGTRITRRALRSDLMRLKAFIELRDEATGGWRGQIEDGEVVDEQDEQDEQPPEERDDEPQAADESEDEDYDDQEPEASEDEEPEAAEDEDYEDEEPEAAEDEDYEDEEPEAAEDEEEPEASEEPDDDEPEPEPKPRRRRRPAAASGRSRS